MNFFIIKAKSWHNLLVLCCKCNRNSLYFSVCSRLSLYFLFYFLFLFVLICFARIFSHFLCFYVVYLIVCIAFMHMSACALPAWCCEPKRMLWLLWNYYFFALFCVLWWLIESRNFFCVAQQTLRHIHMLPALPLSANFCSGVLVRFVIYEHICFGGNLI